MVALMAAGSAMAQAVTFQSESAIYTLQSCVRVAANVECTFRVVSPDRDRDRWFLPSEARLISPTGREATMARVFFNGEETTRYTMRAGIEYTVRLVFNNFPENMIRYFDFGQRRENIPVRTTAAAPAPAPAPVAPAGARTTTALPGQAEWRQRVRLDNTNYMAVVHGCFRATANATTASCLVGLLAENPSGTIGASGNTVLYGATLVQFNGQAITNNTVNLQVGDSLIRAIPVR